MRYFLAFLAFNIYGYLIAWAFGINTLYVFDHELLIDVINGTYKPQESNWIWGEHSVYRLYACCITTFICGFLAGSISQKNGDYVAIISNIPSIIYWCAYLYFFGFTDYLNEEINNQNTWFVLICIVAIPLSTYIAYVAGQAGQEFQLTKYGTDNVLGINGYYWFWGILPLYLYSIMMVFSSTIVALFQLQMETMSIISGIINLLLLIPIFCYYFSLFYTHSILRGEVLSEQNTIVRFCAAMGTLVGGFILSTGILGLIYYIIYKVFS